MMTSVNNYRIGRPTQIDVVRGLADDVARCAPLVGDVRVVRGSAQNAPDVGHRSRSERLNI